MEQKDIKTYHSTNKSLFLNCKHHHSYFYLISKNELSTIKDLTSVKKNFIRSTYFTMRTDDPEKFDIFGNI